MSLKVECMAHPHQDYGQLHALCLMLMATSSFARLYQTVLGKE